VKIKLFLFKNKKEPTKNEQRIVDERHKIRKQKDIIKWLAKERRDPLQ